MWATALLRYYKEADSPPRDVVACSSPSPRSTHGWPAAWTRNHGDRGRCRSAWQPRRAWRCHRGKGSHRGNLCSIHRGNSWAEAGSHLEYGRIRYFTINTHISTLTRLPPRDSTLDGRWTRKPFGLSRVQPIYLSIPRIVMLCISPLSNKHVSLPRFSDAEMWRHCCLLNWCNSAR